MRQPPKKKLDRLNELIEPWFFFSLVWSVGATGDAASCKRFSAWLKGKMTEEKVTRASLLLHPNTNIVQRIVSD